MPLEQMRQFIEDHADVSAQVAQRQAAMFEAHREVLQERLREIQRNLQYVELKAAYWRAVEARDSREVERIACQLRAHIRQQAPQADGERKKRKT